MPKQRDLSGKRFGRLTAQKRSHRANDGKAVWQCRCDCGLDTEVLTHLLVSGRTQSCGCLSRELSARRMATSNLSHGMSRSPEWYSWSAMLSRCGRPSVAGYEKYYGGRAVVVCDQWRTDFTNFLADMGPRPPGTTLDRWPNPHGNYEPNNCRWATPYEQGNNRRDNIIVTINSKQMTVSQACAAAGDVVTRAVARRRLALGWPPLKAVSFPLRKIRKRKTQIVAPT